MILCLTIVHHSHNMEAKSAAPSFREGPKCDSHCHKMISMTFSVPQRDKFVFLICRCTFDDYEYDDVMGVVKAMADYEALTKGSDQEDQDEGLEEVDLCTWLLDDTHDMSVMDTRSLLGTTLTDLQPSFTQGRQSQSVIRVLKFCVTLDNIRHGNWPRISVGKKMSAPQNNMARSN